MKKERSHAGLCRLLLFWCWQHPCSPGCAPYHATSRPVHYKAEGKASCTDPDSLAKRLPAENVLTNAMTAAHKTLPMGTTVRVTNLDNDKSVIVRINDRGPFVRGRIIDLSKAAAHEIDIIGKGTGRVVVVAITAPPDKLERDEKKEQKSAVNGKKRSTSSQHPEKIAEIIEKPHF